MLQGSHTALEGQSLLYTCLAHLELNSIIIVIATHTASKGTV